MTRTAAGYQRERERLRRLAAERSRTGRDIAPLPPVEDPPRRVAGEGDLPTFLKAYFPDVFCLPWSEDHLRVIRAIETATREGGLFAFAMPRGSGKTSIAERAAIWAALTGRHEFIALIAAEESAAVEILASIKTELETNDRLAADFPEICAPIRALEGITNRCRGQLFNGRRTRIHWTQKTIVLPTIPGSRAAGVILKAAGITGRIRGMKYARPDGRVVRPSLVLGDDFQTDASANSPPQCAKRERLVAGAVLGLAGPRRKIAAVWPCTVIRPGDAADAFLDPKRYPAWHAERCPMLYTLPSNTKLWDRYAATLREDLAAGKGKARATAFYAEHREEMDAGARAAWPERFEPDELSAIQHAMTLKIRDEAAFWAEAQNAPLVDELGEDDQLAADEITARINGRPRRTVPADADLLTAFIDVHDALLYWAVCAWSPGFTGALIDYGTHPDQRRAYFTLRDAGPTLASKSPKADKAGAILAGLETLTAELMAREYKREGGHLLRVRLCLIDTGYLPDTITQAIRRSPHAANLKPSAGVGIRAIQKPFAEYHKFAGDKQGDHWRIPNLRRRNRRLLPTVNIDTNAWKSRLRDRLRVAVGDPGALTLWGRDPKRHRLLADHLCGEYFVRVTARGRTVDEWQERPAKPDNHWLDCLVGCMAAACVEGLAWSAAGPGRRPAGRRRRRPPRYLF